MDTPTLSQILDSTLDWWPSPAKLNLFLHINGRLPNGYHQLQSLFQILDYGDQLAFVPDNSGAVKMTKPLAGVKDVDNLIVRAAKALQKASGCQQGCLIHLHKQLPMGGGIGGGSSNAATTLVALNHLWNTQLSLEKLAEIGLKLGADVPIFVKGNSAFASGVGEILQPTEIPSCYYLVANPGVSVATAEVFNAPDLPRDTAPLNWQHYQFESTSNDCQDWVLNRYPQVAKLLRWLLEYSPSRMTGTGASVFARFADYQQALQVLNLLPDPFTGFVAKGVDISPLHIKLAEMTQ